MSKLSASESVESKPWYRYGMVWMIIILPLIAVIASITTLIIASNNAPILLETKQASDKTDS